MPKPECSQADRLFSASPGQPGSHISPSTGWKIRARMSRSWPRISERRQPPPMNESTLRLENLAEEVCHESVRLGLSFGQDVCHPGLQLGLHPGDHLRGSWFHARSATG